MSLRSLLIAAALLIASPALADKPSYTLPALGGDLDGTWEGTFEGSGMSLNVAFTVKSAGANSTITVDLLDAAHGIPVSSASRTGAALHFELKDIAGSFDGALAENGSSMQGTWIQAGKRIPLSLRKRTR